MPQNGICCEWFLPLLKTTCLGACIALMFETEFAGTPAAAAFVVSLLLLVGTEIAQRTSGDVSHSTERLRDRLSCVMIVMCLQFPVAQHALSGKEEWAIEHLRAAAPLTCASFHSSAVLHFDPDAEIIAIAPSACQGSPPTSSPIHAGQLFALAGCRASPDCLHPNPNSTILLQLLETDTPIPLYDVLPFTLEEAWAVGMARRSAIWSVSAGAWACAAAVVLLLSWAEGRREQAEAETAAYTVVGEEVVVCGTKGLEEAEEEEGEGAVEARQGGGRCGRTVLEDGLHGLACGVSLCLGLVVHYAVAARLGDGLAAEGLTCTALVLYSAILFATG